MTNVIAYDAPSAAASSASMRSTSCAMSDMTSSVSGREDAEQIRGKRFAPDFTPDAYDIAGDEILQALLTGAARTFDIDSSVVISGADIRPMVIVRMDGRAWTLPSFEAALLALRIRLSPDLRAADLFADAFCLASVQAENKLAGLHDWSTGVRPTQDVE